MRPDTQIFLHVLGAMGLFGSVAVVAALGLTAKRHAAQQTALAIAALVTTIFVSVPSWALMLAFGVWSKSKEGIPDGVTWIAIGSGIASSGIIVLLVTCALAYWWMRRPASAWQPRLLGLVASGYLVALGVAWWVMSTKVPS